MRLAPRPGAPVTLRGVRVALAVRWLGLAAALWVLNFALSFHNVWPTFWITTHHEISIEIAVLILALAVWSELRGPPSMRLLTVVALVLLVMTFGRYAEVTAPALYGRRINLYWDARFIPGVAAMMFQVVPAWLIVVGAAGIAALLTALFLLLRTCLARVVRGFASVAERRAVGGLAAALVALYVAGTAGALPTLRWFSLPVSGTYTDQIQFIAAAVAEQRNGGPDLPPAADFGSGPLPRLGRADVLLVFMESYGATSYDDPKMRAALVPAREELARAVAATGRYAASAFMTLPTFGGGSWLAHSSLMTGSEVRENAVYNLLLTQHRDSLPRRLERNGYRTIAVMPGLKEAWPEGSFYGFDRIYGLADLHYRGPQFGWWKVPDEYTLAKLDQMELATSPRKPLFVFFPTISTHMPFRPTAPYQADWQRVLGKQPFDAAPLAASLAEKPEWTDMRDAYVGALDYTFRYWAGYLRRRPDADFVLILIGDHQPASSVSGEGARWDVPVHVISKRRDIVDALLRDGFVEGFTPAQKSIGPMHTLAPMLLADFGGAPEPAAPAPGPAETAPPATAAAVTATAAAVTRPAAH